MSWLNYFATHAYNANKRETELLMRSIREDVDTIGSWSHDTGR